MKLARGLGYEAREQVLPREALYVADEVFMTGTAAEITPVRSVDGIPTRAAGPGPVTKAVNKAFRGLFDGATPDRYGWLEPIGEASAAAPAPVEERAHEPA
ncbi:Branched-chain-amino-acid aminotransferase [compost metagenome]